jgi:ribosomal protein L24
MKPVSLKLLAKYENQYIALSKDKSEVIVSGATIKELHKQLEKMKKEDVIIHFVPPIHVAVSPVCL